jgi:hypothetical protein
MSLQADSQATLDALGQAGLLGDVFLFDKIKQTNLLVGVDCSPFWGDNSACSNKALCCENTSQNGLLAFGCENFSFIKT